MKRKIITIENGVVSVPTSNNIWMTQHEISTLFEVYTQTINANIKAILKTGVVKTDISCLAVVAVNVIMPDVYGLEMITALAFRIKSRNTDIFRKWLMGKASKAEIPEMLIMSIRNPILN